MTIQGYVYDIETSEPLIGTRVTLLDDERKKSKFYTATDKSGYFLMDDPYIQSTDTILFEQVGYEKIEKDASELEDAKIKMTAKVDFLATSDKKAEEEIPLSPTEEEQEKPKDHTMRNIAIAGGLIALGVIAWYFSKKKE
jgi:hypothetical protein